MIGRDILRDNSAGPDQRAISNGHSLQDNSASANKDKFADFHRPRICDVLIAPAMDRIKRMKIVVQYHCTRARNGSFADADAFPGTKDRSTQTDIRANYQFSPGRQCAQDTWLETTERIGAQSAVQAQTGPQNHS